MAYKIFYILFGIIVAIESGLNAPLDIFPKFIENAIEERVKLVDIVFPEVVSITKLKLEHKRNVIQKVLNDPKVLEVDTYEVKSYLRELSEFVRDFENPEKQTYYHLDFLCDDIENRIYWILKHGDPENKDGEPAARLIRKSLEDNDIYKYDKEIEKRISNYIKKFVQEVETYLGSLDEKERQTEDYLAYLLGLVKNEKDMEQQNMYVMDFIENIEHYDKIPF